MDLLKKNSLLKPKKPASPHYNNGAGPVTTGKGVNGNPVNKTKGRR